MDEDGRKMDRNAAKDERNAPSPHPHLAARRLDFFFFLNPSVELRVVKNRPPGRTKFNWSCGTCLPFSSVKQRRRHVAAAPKSGPQMSPETQREFRVLTNKSFV